jgi:hypothetical protein
MRRTRGVRDRNARLTKDKRPGVHRKLSAEEEQRLRELAVKQPERRRFTELAP